MLGSCLALNLLIMQVLILIQGQKCDKAIEMMRSEASLDQLIERFDFGLVQFLDSQQLCNSSNDLNGERIGLFCIQKPFFAISIHGHFSHCLIAGNATLKFLKKVIISCLCFLVSLQ